MAEAPNPDKELAWKKVVTKEQQLFYEQLGDRDWDCYKESEMVYLERNVGHAIYGPPDELPDKEQNGSTGYTKDKLMHIRKICAVIKEHSKHSSGSSDSDVWVAMIFVCLNIEKCSVPVPVPVFRIPSHDAKTQSDDSYVKFVDSNCRIYKDWNHFLETNQLPACAYCYPVGGVYKGDSNDEVLLEFGKTPASNITNTVCSALDITSSVVMAGGMAVSIAALFTTVAAPLAVASTVGAVTTGIYGAGRSIAALNDRDQHNQSINLDNAESRNCWLSIFGNFLGIASAQGVRTLTKMAQNGEVMCRAGRLAVTALNFGSLTVSGLGLVNNFASLHEKARSGKVTTLDVFQFTSSCLFFTMSAVNVKTADSIIRETQSGVIGDFEKGLRSNRHRRAFRKVAKETRGEDGNTMHGNAKVIRGITHINDKDDFFAGLVRVGKQYGKSEAKVSLTDNGMVEINGELRIDPMRFSDINKMQRQVILNATKNLKQGAWSQKRFNEEVQTICKEQKIVFESQQTNTVSSVNRAMNSNVCKTGKQKSLPSELKTQNPGSVMYWLKDMAQEHHEKILTVARNLAEMLGFKKTAEFLRIVQFVVNYVKQVAAEVEGKYQEDLRSAQVAQGHSFNREQFDLDYEIQGNRYQHFISVVLVNYNTYEALIKLKNVFLNEEPQETRNSSASKGEKKKTDDTEDKPEETRNSSASKGEKKKTHDTEGKPEETRNSSASNSVSSEVETFGEHEKQDNKKSGRPAGTDDSFLYKKDRNFETCGNLSDEEMYDIAREVTGLFLYGGNAVLRRDGAVTLIVTNDPHIESVVVVINSDLCNNTVTATIVF